VTVRQSQERPAESAAAPFASYVQIAKSLLPSIDGICLFGPSLEVLGATRALATEAIAGWYKALRENQPDAATLCAALSSSEWVTSMRLEQTDGRELGVLCITEKLADPPTQPSRHGQRVHGALKPLLECVHRDLQAAYPKEPRLRAMTQRSEQLEWLFKLTNSLGDSSDDARLIEKLLEAATQRLQAGFGALFVPDKRLSIERCIDSPSLALFNDAWNQARQPVLAWVQRQHRPLMVNRSPKSKLAGPTCKLLAVPVVRENGFIIGVLAFLKPPDGTDFSDTHLFLARHLGRQAGQLVDRQYDLMTGLYTRGGLEEMAASIAHRTVEEHSILYLDIDHMHVVNELHGFEIGNELIVRVAELLTVPLLPENAVAARLESDRFAVVLPCCGVDAAAAYARAVLAAAGKMAIGPLENSVQVSLSGGVAPLMDVDPPFQRALSAAELACKTAKNRGRARVETYAFEDVSMMRRHVDVVAVGRLREALKGDRFLLYAQPIVSLSSTDSFAGYEILLRLKEDNGSVASAGDLIQAATRYQLLPSLDKWVTKRALEMLAPYRSMLATREISLSLNVTGQSISDESFVTLLCKQLQESRLPANCITIEITEQAAVTNLARANQLMNSLKAYGCQFALDDFGTGANSLTTLQSLPISKLKIDGSFVRNVITDRNSHSTVRAIVELARGLSLDTVAEYVETAEIATELHRLGVDYAQGHAFGEAEPLSDVLRSLNQDESRRLHRLYLES
jgi:diguanylate cyclase (GGDEF)-like protein